MMYISTDYIFDGKGTRPWEPDDPVTTPLNVYGQTKYEGELAVRANVQKFFIVRIAWVFGKGKNFIKTMLNLAKTHDHLTVVNDQYGTADLHLRSGKTAGGYDRDRQIRQLSRDQRGRLHHLV